MPFPLYPRTELNLSDGERQTLERLRDHHAKAYVRERAAAILKVAGGQSVYAVAERGLLRRRKAETVSDWIKRYRAEGASGLLIQAGRGRKPAFSPSRPRGRGRSSRTTASGPS